MRFREQRRGCARAAGGLRRGKRERVIIDAFPHILPRACLDRFTSVANAPALEFLNGLQRRPHLVSMWDMDARFRIMDEAGEYQQILSLSLRVGARARRSTTPDYEGEAVSRLGMWASLGWPYEMGLFAARMVASGVLDRYPRLRIYLHHSGGMTPTFSRRVNGSWLELQALAPEAAYARLQRSVAEYFTLFYADTSGQTPISIRAALEFLGIEHVLLGSDAPFGPLANHLATLAQLDLSAEDRGLLLGGNAERVLLQSSARR
jgi:predicted TIM-barrel fold metal-dependent hydrolase